MRALIIGCAVLTLTAWATAPAWPHSWYSARCCGGTDCSPIPVEAVGFDANGDYLVTIAAGAHPMVTVTQTWVVPRNTAEVSQDGFWHACIVGPADKQRVRCLYEPRTF